MKASDAILPECILNVSANDKPSAIRLIVEQLIQAGKLQLADADMAVRKLSGREELGSTGVGGGIAVPKSRWQ